MEVKLPGIGSAFNDAFRNSSVLIDDMILLDCGPNVLPALPLKGAELEAVAITHLHGDHIYGLERLGFMGYFVHKKRPGLFVPSKLKDDLSCALIPTMMALQGPNGGSVLASGLHTFFCTAVADTEDWMQWRIGGKVYWIRFIPVSHIEDVAAFAIQITDLDTSVLYTGDTREPILPLLDDFSVSTTDKYYAGKEEPGVNATNPDRGVWYPEDTRLLTRLSRKIIIHDVSKHNIGAAGVHCPADVLKSSVKNYRQRDWMKNVEIVATHLDWHPDKENPLEGSGIRIPEEMVEL